MLLEWIASRQTRYKQHRHNRWIATQQAKYTRRYIEEFTHARNDADVFVVSFPKSGRTWHRVMLGVYLAKMLDQPVSKAMRLTDLCHAAGIKSIAYSHNGANFLDWLPPDHELVASPTLWKDKAVILLTRDPRDVVVSSYFHARYRDGKFDGDISQFLRNPQTGIDKVLTAYNRWSDNRHLANRFEMTSYEEMHQNPRTPLRQALGMLELHTIDEKDLLETVNFCRFDNMQKQEETDFYRSWRLRSGSSEPRSRKTREGTVGGYKNHLSPEDIEFVNKRIGLIGDPFVAQRAPSA
ncbi:MAG: sulfotransferase domain-containing protein [Pseudomonadota bacterium]